jgi:hypothetical protein
MYDRIDCDVTDNDLIVHSHICRSINTATINNSRQSISVIDDRDRIVHSTNNNRHSINYIWNEII